MIHSLQTNQIRVSFPEVDLSMKVEIPNSFLSNIRASKWLRSIYRKAISAESTSCREESGDHSPRPVFLLRAVVTRCSACSQVLSLSHWGIFVVFCLPYFVCGCSYLQKFFLESHTDELSIKSCWTCQKNLNMFISLGYTKVMKSTDGALSMVIYSFPEDPKKNVLHGLTAKSTYSSGQGTRQESEDQMRVASLVIYAPSPCRV